MKTAIMSVFIVVTSLAAQSVQAEKWAFATFEVPPHACEKCPGQGAMISAIREGLKTKGIELEVKFFPYIRAQKEAAAGKFVGYFPEWPSDLPKEGFVASQTIYESPVVFVTPKDKPLAWKAMSDLKGKTIGVVNGYSYGDDFTKAQTGGVFKVDSANDEATNLRKVLGGRLDATVMDANNARAMLVTEKLDKSKFEIQSQLVVQIPNIVGFSKAGTGADDKMKLFNSVVTKDSVAKAFEKYMKENY